MMWMSDRKTASSYTRYTEARAIWAKMITEGRSLTSRIVTRGPSTSGRVGPTVNHARHRAVKLIRTLPLTLKYHLCTRTKISSERCTLTKVSSERYTRT